MDASQFLSALLAIIVIDIVLAGDNAIVIALAARSLPAHLQRKAILWGAVGAIVVRSAMTLVVVWLLKVPGLLLAGGAMLVWIAWKLLQPQSDDAGAHGPAATTFWGAMRTVIIADAVMGLDNVLAVAGAAHGNYALVVAGLVISVPIVVWGSTLVLKVVARFPVVVYLGSGVLLWTAVKMMGSEPVLAGTLQQWPAIRTAAWLLIPLVLGLAWWRQAQHRARVVAGTLNDQATPAQNPAEPEGLRSHPLSTGGHAMLNVLVPTDGSPNALQALRHAAQQCQANPRLRLHLLNVQPRLSRHVARLLSVGDRSAWHRDRAETALAPAKQLLKQWGVPFDAEWCLGRRAEAICRAAERLGAHHIVMGTARKSSLTRLLEDSVTHQVLQSTQVPVEVVAGRNVSTLERWGVPASVGLGLGSVLWMALD